MQLQFSYPPFYRLKCWLQKIFLSQTFEAMQRLCIQTTDSFKANLKRIFSLVNNKNISDTFTKSFFTEMCGICIHYCWSASESNNIFLFFYKCIKFLVIIIFFNDYHFLTVVFGKLVQNSYFSTIFWKRPLLYKKSRNTIRFPGIWIRIPAIFMHISEQKWLYTSAGK